jgi:ubiquinone/menaquinone biosynthesis C-methylase UbiE
MISHSDNACPTPIRHRIRSSRSQILARKSELYFEEIGDDFNRFMSTYDVFRRLALINNLLNIANAKGRAFEVGCGTGAITPALIARDCDVTVGDISAKLAAETARKFSVKGMQCDAMAIALPDNSVDVVVSSEVIEHVLDPRMALCEMARVVAPGGCVVVTSPNKLWLPLLQFAQLLKIRKFAGNEEWLWPASASRIMREQGLEVLVMSGCHLFPWQVPCAKKLLPFFDRFGRYLWPVMINWGILCRKPRRIPPEQAN